VSRYYFHLRDGHDVLLDPEGQEFPSLPAIEAAALENARDIISHDAREGRIMLAYHLDVEDAAGAIVHRLDFEDAVEVIRGPAND
jgi:hypothetical protein